MRLNNTKACFVIAGTYLVLRFFTPLIRPDLLDARLAVILSIAVLMIAQIALIVGISSLGLKLRHTALYALLSAGAFIGLLLTIWKTHHLLPGIALYSASVAQDFLLMIFAAFLGVTISYIIRERNLILPVAIFAGLVDLWNVGVGPLGQIIEKKPEIVEAVAVQMPTPIPSVPGTMIGMGDFVFLAMFFSALFRFGMNVKGAFWLAYSLLTLSMLIIIAFGIALPGLIPIGLAIILTNIGHFRLTRQESFAIILIVILALIFLAASTLFLFRN